jgi:uncharacterized flavoprotein (TIGR03862 family)
MCATELPVKRLSHTDPHIAVIGGGPAGLMATEMLGGAPLPVILYDSMRSVGRKFLLAGKGGLNLTHSEPFGDFCRRYGPHEAALRPFLETFGPAELRQWAHDLGIDTFVGSSGRVFPAEMKAAPLLRRWLSRLRAAGIQFALRHRWQGWTADGALRFTTPDGEKRVRPTAVILALGGASWPQLGSDAAWVPWLQARGIPITPLQPANCGFTHPWSDHFRGRFAGTPLKTVALRVADSEGNTFQRRGEFVIADYGVEGSLIYAAGALIREEIGRAGTAVVHLDLVPDFTLAALTRKLSRPRGSRSLSSHLQSRTGLKGVKTGLLWEFLPRPQWEDPAALAAAIKNLPIPLHAPRPIAEAISSAGGVSFTALDENLMVKSMPGLFCAGEMLDWEAPTGGYLLTACFATGRAAGLGVRRWLEKRPSTPATNVQRKDGM